MEYSVEQLAEEVGGELIGAHSGAIFGVSLPKEASERHLVLLANEHYEQDVRECRAGVILTSRRFLVANRCQIVVDDPDRSFIRVLNLFSPPLDRPPPGKHPSAIIGEDVELGDNAAIGPQVVIGRGSRIGDGVVLHAGTVIGSDVRVGQQCVLWPNVVVRERCIIEDRVIIHPNTTIGSDGFGFQFIDGRHEKIPQIGHVVIESDVEIGANCSVDRGKWGATVIGSGTKIDNLVQIAHNVRIGRHCVIVSQVGIAGSSELGNHVVLGGKVGVRDHIRLGDGVQVAGASGVIKDTPDGAVVSGVPAIPHRRYLRERAAVRRLPEWTDRLKDLIQRVERLEAANDD